MTIVALVTLNTTATCTNTLQILRVVEGCWDKGLHMLFKHISFIYLSIYLSIYSLLFFIILLFIYSLLFTHQLNPPRTPEDLILALTSVAEAALSLPVLDEFGSFSREQQEQVARDFA